MGFGCGLLAYIRAKIVQTARVRLHEKELPMLPSASTFQREFHDRVSGQQHAGTSYVLGPCQWHRLYRTRSRSNRSEPKSADRRALLVGRPLASGRLMPREGNHSTRRVIQYPCARRTISSHHIAD